MGHALKEHVPVKALAALDELAATVEPRICGNGLEHRACVDLSVVRLFDHPAPPIKQAECVSMAMDARRYSIPYAVAMAMGLFNVVPESWFNRR